LQIANRPPSHRKENTLKPKNPINAILDTLAAQQRQGETSLVVTIEPDLIQEAMNALRGYGTLFAPVIAGLTDTAPIYEIYERMRQANQTKHSILLFVECQTIQESREALDRLPLRKSSEWRPFFNDSEWRSFFNDRIG
jgi:hypothetical protein